MVDFCLSLWNLDLKNRLHKWSLPRCLIIISSCKLKSQQKVYCKETYLQIYKFQTYKRAQLSDRTISCMFKGTFTSAFIGFRLCK